MTRYHYFIAGAAAVGGALLAIPALAENPTGGPAADDITVSPNTATGKVDFADLDLTSSSGQDILVARVKAMARVVCDHALGRPADPLDSSECRFSALNDARPQIRRAFATSHELAARGQVSVTTVEIAVSTPAGPRTGQVAAR